MAHGFDYLHVARASAQIAAQRQSYFVVFGVGILVEEAFRRNNHPGSAEPALGCTQFLERGVQRMGALRISKTRNRCDFTSFTHPSQGQATINSQPVDQYGTGTAITLAAPMFDLDVATVP